MNAHWAYVYSAYGLVFIALLWQWLLPWLRWHRCQRQYKKRMKHHEERAS